MDEGRLIGQHDPLPEFEPTPEMGEHVKAAITEHSEALETDSAMQDVMGALGAFDGRHPGWELYEPAMMEAARNIDPRGRDADQYLEEIYAAATKAAPATPAEPQGDFGRAWRLAKRGVQLR